MALQALQPRGGRLFRRSVDTALAPCNHSLTIVYVDVSMRSHRVKNKGGKLLTNQTTVIVDITICKTTLVRAAEHSKASVIYEFDDAVNIKVKRCNKPERQDRVLTCLKSLSSASFRFGENLDASSTLTALANEIAKLSPMRAPQYQGEVHAVEHLRNAVIDETWANDFLSAMSPQTISFSEFVTNLPIPTTTSFSLPSSVVRRAPRTS
jgi:hypothetical protein